MERRCSRKVSDGDCSRRARYSRSRNWLRSGRPAGTRRALATVPSDLAVADPGALERASRSAGAVAYLMPTGHNPTGTVMTTIRRQPIAAIADAGKLTVIEDLSLADLVLGNGPPPPPLAAFSPRVIAIGSVSKLLWAELPLASADAFAHAAARHGVTIAAGSTVCLDGRHHSCVRLSFAEPLATLEFAAERLAAAWEDHTRNLAATPAPRSRQAAATQAHEGPSAT